MSTLLGRPAELLLVEDNEGDVRLTQEALRRGKVANNLYVVGDGEEAEEFLRRKGKWAAAPRPDLILLDLNLPRKDGRELLATIKTDPDLKYIPVVVLTTSNDEQDVLKSYALHANCYVTKPVGLPEFIEIVHAIQGFWLQIACLPTKKDG